MRISDWSSDVCSSDLDGVLRLVHADPDEAVVVVGQHVADLVERDVAQLAAGVVDGRVDHAGRNPRLVVGLVVGSGLHPCIVPPPRMRGKQIAVGRGYAPHTARCSGCLPSGQYYRPTFAIPSGPRPPTPHTPPPT